MNFVDLTNEVDRIKAIKSAEEIEWLKKGAALTDAALSRVLAEVCALDHATRQDMRYRKFRAMGNVGINEG